MSRYSQLYIERGKPAQDSERFRRRLCLFVERELSESAGKIVAEIEWTGAVVPSLPSVYGPSAYANLRSYFEKATVPDLLDAITIVLQVLRPPNPKGTKWQEYVERVFREENLTYRLGSDGIVHPHIDQEFEANRAAAIETLNSPKFNETKHGFNEAFRHLRNGEGRQAVRMMFPAVETAARVLFPGEFQSFDVNQVARHLQPRLEAKYAGNEPALKAGRQMLEGLKKWITASHNYRHGQEVESLAHPPQDLVVAYVSTGAAFLRWMIELVE
jgi:hypothetical protein